MDQRINYLYNELDLSSVRRRFQAVFCPDTTADADFQDALYLRIEREYRRFLILKFVHGDSHGHLFAAPFPIYKFWEQHVLHTVSYSQMIRRLGVDIHFDPEYTDPATDTTQARRLANVIDCYRARFGLCPVEPIWHRVLLGGDDDGGKPVVLDRATAILRVVCGRADEQKVVELVIKTLTGRRYSISLNQDICVGQLRDAICVYEGTPPDQMRLNLCGKQLEEGRFLVGDYNVADKTELLLVLRLRGC